MRRILKCTRPAVAKVPSPGIRGIAAQVREGHRRQVSSKGKVRSRRRASHRNGITIGIRTAFCRHRQADVVQSADSVGMAGVEQHRRAAIAKVPRICRCTCRSALNSEIGLKAEDNCRKASHWRWTNDGHILATRACATSIGCCEADIVGAGRSVGMAWILRSRSSAITKVPAPRSRYTRGSICERQLQQIGRVAEGCRRRLANRHRLATDIDSAGIRRCQTDAVAARSSISMRRILQGGGVSVPKIPAPANRRIEGVVGECCVQASRGRGILRNRKWLHGNRHRRRRITCATLVGHDHGVGTVASHQNRSRGLTAR